MSTKLVVSPIEISFNSVWMLLPEYGSLRNALDAKGYTLTRQGGGGVSVLATKGSIEIVTNVHRRVVGISSETSTKDLLIASEDLDQIYEELGIEPTNLLFYEFVGGYSIEAAKSPLHQINGLKMEGDIIRKIGAVLEKDVVPLGLNLTVKDGNPTDINWFQLEIQPLYVSSNKKYLVKVIYRGNKTEVVDFVKKIESRIKRIIEELEAS